MTNLDHPLPSSGLVAISITPLTPQGVVDVSSIGPLMEFYLRCGATGVALLGVMGEANRMTDEEARIVVDEAMVAINGRVPVIVGISDESLARMVSLAAHARERGVSGVLLQPLPGLAGDEMIAGYFKVVSDVMGDMPICVQDFPKANGVHISLQAWQLIVERCPTVLMLKAEDEPGLSKLSAIRRAESDGLRRVTILGGNNGIHLPQELARGADGVMTGFAFPDVLARVIELTSSGRSSDAEDLFDLYLPINRHELRTGISVRKELLHRRGAIPSATARYPAPLLTAADHLELDRLLERLNGKTGRPLDELVL